MDGEVEFVFAFDGWGGEVGCAEEGEAFGAYHGDEEGGALALEREVDGRAGAEVIGWYGF